MSNRYIYYLLLFIFINAAKKRKQRKTTFINPVWYCEINEWEKEINKWPETQRIVSLFPHKKCKVKDSTVFFLPDRKYLPQYNISSFSISMEEINDPRYFITISKKMINFKNIKKVFRDNGIIINTEQSFSNLIFDHCSKLTFKDIDKYQKVSKFLTNKLLDNKSRVSNKYKLFRKMFGEKEFNFMPESLSYPENKATINKQFSHYNLDFNNLWIIKPKVGKIGKGIQFFRNLKQLRQIKKAVLMKYVSNPLLLNGYKSDIRLFVLVTSFNPMKIYLYRDGFVKLCTHKYKKDLRHLNDKFMHLTNFHINRDNTRYKYNDDYDKEKGNLWTLRTLMRHLEKNGKNTKIIWNRIVDMVIKVIMFYPDYELEKLKKWERKGMQNFQIFGMDIILDENLNPYFLETNSCPDLSWEHIMSRKVCNQIVRDTLNIVGLRSYDHLTPDWIKETKYSIKDIVDESICEFYRPTGNYERIFPTLGNIDKYKYYLKYTSENIQLWNEMKKVK